MPLGCPNFIVRVRYGPVDKFDPGSPSLRISNPMVPVVRDWVENIWVCPFGAREILQTDGMNPEVSVLVVKLGTRPVPTPGRCRRKSQVGIRKPPCVKLRFGNGGLDRSAKACNSVPCFPWPLSFRQPRQTNVAGRKSHSGKPAVDKIRKGKKRAAKLDFLYQFLCLQFDLLIG